MLASQSRAHPPPAPGGCHTLGHCPPTLRPQGQVPDNQGQPLHPTAHGNNPSEPTLGLLTRPCLLLPTEATVKALAVCSPRSLCLLANAAPSLRGPAVCGLETHHLSTSSHQSRLDLLHLSTTKACVLRRTSVPVLPAFVRRLPPQSHAFHDGNSRGLKQAQTLLGVGLCSLLYPCLCPHETVSEQGRGCLGLTTGEEVVSETPFSQGAEQTHQLLVRAPEGQWGRQEEVRCLLCLGPGSLWGPGAWMLPPWAKSGCCPLLGPGPWEGHIQEACLGQGRGDHHHGDAGQLPTPSISGLRMHNEVSWMRTRRGKWAVRIGERGVWGGRYTAHKPPLPVPPLEALAHPHPSLALVSSSPSHTAPASSRW